jgi:hypothetical protein
VSDALVALTVANVAVTLRACVIDTEQVESVPVQAPPHPVNAEPKLGLAVIVTRAVAAWLAAHPDPPAVVQLRPAPVILPLPVTCPESTYVVLLPANVAWTLAAPVMVSVHVVDLKAEQAPPHETKSPLVPDAGTAVSVNDVFDWTLAVQPGPFAAVQ